jgi:hypothetical protein
MNPKSTKHDGVAAKRKKRKTDSDQGPSSNKGRSSDPLQNILLTVAMNSTTQLLERCSNLEVFLPNGLWILLFSIQYSTFS